ncbi:glutamine-hydrolyzing carbamoyl-phosphate synthase small subunit [Streptomyces angustmyceticus]|uniref:glutamine-hydrolyzing carbamoyl-phosphate synthase small subunit n=1 Tax=Streptomyces angustmyceticus TaxID=285578 RepID=UPI001CBCFC50|nr:glutamine-hydrolyzing carbamoyl-phosphate synthase small subunit [Streptomyces angustmyceticus]
MLVLEDGRIFHGAEFGRTGSCLGEVVFTTGMTGYQETLTDPSYHRQIVVSTAPQIGNTGWNDEDDESQHIWVAGYAVRDPARMPSSWRSRRSLEAELVDQGVVGIAGVDTRGLTRHVREHGTMRGGIFSGSALSAPKRMVAQVSAGPRGLGAELATQVTTCRPYVVPARGRKRFTVAALDLGIKTNTPRMMALRGMEVHILPSSTPLDEVLAIGADGVFLSNGPGDPATADAQVELVRRILDRRIPLFGICFGNQILGRALGRETYKLRYGHRGINIPVVDATTGAVAITAQNHGFAVEGEPGEEFATDFGPAAVSHHCANDCTVEGLRLLDRPAFSVQFHPESAAGPHDAAPLFDHFAQLMEGDR